MVSKSEGCSSIAHDSMQGTHLQQQHVSKSPPSQEESQRDTARLKQLLANADEIEMCRSLQAAASQTLHRCDAGSLN